MTKPTERGKRLIEIVDRQWQLQDRLAIEFSDFTKYWYSSQFIHWVSRNNRNLQQSLEVQLILFGPESKNFINAKREEVEFHYYNYLASIAGCMTFLFKWAENSGIKEINSVILEFKRSPIAKILISMRNCILHGAKAFANWGVSMRNEFHSGPGDPGVNCTFDLSETLTEKLSELPTECQEKVSEIQFAQENNLDWLGPLANEGALLLQTAWNSAREVFEKHNKTVLETREGIIEKLKALEEEYHRIGPLPISELGFPLKSSSSE